MSKPEMYSEGGFFSKLFFEVREENVPSSVKIETVRMYEKTKAGDARLIGRMTYALHPDARVEIQGFHIEDWDEKAKFASRFVKWFQWFARKKRKGGALTGGIFSTDTRTGEKLEAFRSLGFSVKEAGSMAGHSEYVLEYRY